MYACWTCHGCTLPTPIVVALLPFLIVDHRILSRTCMLVIHWLQSLGIYLPTHAPWGETSLYSIYNLPKMERECVALRVCLWSDNDKERNRASWSRWEGAGASAACFWLNRLSFLYSVSYLISRGIYNCRRIALQPIGTRPSASGRIYTCGRWSGNSVPRLQMLTVSWVSGVSHFMSKCSVWGIRWQWSLTFETTVNLLLFWQEEHK